MKFQKNHTNCPFCGCISSHVHLKFLPPYSPALNPAETLFALLRSMANFRKSNVTITFAFREISLSQANGTDHG